MGPQDQAEQGDRIVLKTAKWQALAVCAALATGIGCSGGGSDSGADANSNLQPAVDSGVMAAAEVSPVITPEDLALRLQGEDVPVILDVRSPEEYDQGHIPGAINIPYDQVAASLDGLDSFREREIVVYCRTGRRAEIAEEALAEAGFEQVRDLEGHMVAWQDGNFPVAVPAVN
jgi:rhodanese-related sulfurtransferase